ncbi:preprotein translocase subunit SecA [compost metagenome]
MLDSVAGKAWAKPAQLLRSMGGHGLAARWLRYAQARTEKKLARERRHMVAADEELENSLSFSGQGD